MAFLGSLGKALGISTPEAVQIGASFASGGLISGIGTAISSLGTPRPLPSTIPVDVSPRPAGVDSPATISPASQTSRTSFDSFGFPGGMGMTQDLRPRAPIQAGFPLAAPAIQFGKQLFRSPGSSFGTGAVSGFIGDTVMDMFGRPKKFVITRKLQREVKKVFMMSGGDIGFVAQNSTMLFGKDLNEDQILMVLFKTFKNQGPYVTKAAVRKTRSTIRKMETLCDLKDRLCPPKRATPRRRTMGSTTKVLQVK